jgi:hypothetical protein
MCAASGWQAGRLVVADGAVATADRHEVNGSLRRRHAEILDSESVAAV